MRHLAALLLVGAAGALAYANAGRGTLVFDARLLLAGNPVMQAATADTVRYLLTHDYWQPMATDGLYRPLTMLSLLVGRVILGHGDAAAGYVAENLALHVGSAMLLYALVWRAARRRWAATVAALLFVVHPVTAEVVSNVAGRADALATFGVLAGVVAWSSVAAARGPGRGAWMAGLAVAAVIAFFGKESGLVLVPAVLLWDAVLGDVDRGARRPLVRAEHVVLATVLLGYLVARWWVAASGLPPAGPSPVDNPIAEAGFVAGRLTAFGVLARDAALVAWPATLSIDYSYRQVPLATWPPAALADWIGVAGAAGTVAATWAVWRARRRAPAIAFFGAFALVAVLPTANLLRVIGSIMAERFLHLPLAGAAAVAALGLDRLAPRGARRLLATALVAVVVLGAGARTAVRNLDWRDERTVWAAALRAAPESAKAHKGFAAALDAPDADATRLGEMVASAERAVAIRPDYRPALVDLGGYEIRLGDAVGAGDPAAANRWYETAVAALERARSVDERERARFAETLRARGWPDDAVPPAGDVALYNNLSLAYVKLGRLDDALAASRRLRWLLPTRTDHYRDIAAIELALGRPDDAAVTLLEAVIISDEDVEAKARLAEVYRTLAPADAPIVTEGPQGETQIHTSHPVVRRHRCRAWSELATIFAEARLADLATEARTQAATCAGRSEP